MLKQTLILAIAAGLALAANAAPLKVGAMSGPESSLVEAAAKVAKEKYNLDVDILTFDDYVTPNVALADGTLDLNAFQHRPYLDSMMQGNKLDTEIVAVGNTFVYPIGGYSKSLQNIGDLKDGATIAIPDDPSNEGRTLLLLDKKGLIKLKDNNILTASILDIAENPHKFKFLEVQAPQLPRMLDEADLAFINSNYAVSAGLNPSKDPIIVEDKESPYVNIIAARAEDQDKKEIKEFVDAYQSEAVEQAAQEVFKGGAVKGW